MTLAVALFFGCTAFPAPVAKIGTTARDPLAASTFGLWRPGDTYLVYPGVRASSRWEMLRDGIEACEKIRILREKGKMTDRLASALAKIDWPTAHAKADAEIAADVAEVFAAIADAAR